MERVALVTAGDNMYRGGRPFVLQPVAIGPTTSGE